MKTLKLCQIIALVTCISFVSAV